MDRKAEKEAWKETKPDTGIYAVRIGAAVWIGATVRLSAAEQRLRFTLKNGLARDRAMQAAYQGEMTFEVLEAFDDDIGAMTRERLLKERRAHWLEQTGGKPV